MSIEEEAEVRVTPKEHYNWAMNLLAKASEYEAGSGERTNTLLEALTHVMMGGLRDALDYAAAKHDKPSEGEYPSIRFEEDEDDRP